MIYAVDFDNTIAFTNYPSEENVIPNYNLINFIKEKQSQGHKFILWTCREDKDLAFAVNWCKEHGLIFDAVNENLPEEIIRWNNDCRKVGADVYIDDRAITPNMIESEVEEQ